MADIENEENSSEHPRSARPRFSGRGRYWLIGSYVAFVLGAMSTAYAIPQPAVSDFELLLILSSWLSFVAFPIHLVLRFVRWWRWDRAMQAYVLPGRFSWKLEVRGAGRGYFRIVLGGTEIFVAITLIALILQLAPGPNPDDGLDWILGLGLALLLLGALSTIYLFIWFVWRFFFEISIDGQHNWRLLWGIGSLLVLAAVVVWSYWGVYWASFE